MLEHVSEDCDCRGKACTKCHAIMCVGWYTKDKRLKSGLKSECRKCAAIKSKEWREKNREYNSHRKKKWIEANKERALQSRRQYATAHRAHINELARLRRKNNYEQRRAREKIFEMAYKEKRRQNRKRPEIQEKERSAWKEYYWANKEWMNARVMRWQKLNPRKHAITEAARRARKTQAGGRYTIEQWENLKTKYNYTCLCCGKREPEIELHADHIVPIAKGGHSNIDNIQPLCRSCNSSKGTKIIDFRP